MPPSVTDLPARLEPAVRAVIAARDAGEPGILMIRSPGLGASMLASRIPTMIDLTEHQRRWIAVEHDAWTWTWWTDRNIPAPTRAPFQAPHYTINATAMAARPFRAHDVRCLNPTTPRCICGLASDRSAGGHVVTKASVCELARFGVLLLDEIEEFQRSTLEAARERLTRMGPTAPFVVAAARPCPCGYGAPEPAGSAYWRDCECSADAIARHVARVQRHAGILRLVRSVVLPTNGIATRPTEPAGGGPRCPDLATIRAAMAAERAA